MTTIVDRLKDIIIGFGFRTPPSITVYDRTSYDIFFHGRTSSLLINVDMHRWIAIGSYTQMDGVYENYTLTTRDLVELAVWYADYIGTYLDEQ